MEIWVDMNKKNNFNYDFFWPSNSKEIWTTDIVTGPFTNHTFDGSFLKVKLGIPKKLVNFLYQQ